MGGSSINHQWLLATRDSNKPSRRLLKVLLPPEKKLKSTVFEMQQWLFFTENWLIFHQEGNENGMGLSVLGSKFWNKSEFQIFWNFRIFGSWTQSGHMIAPFWSRNLSDTTHERSHTKCQHIWAVNIAFTTFTRGGAESSLVKGGSRTLQYYGLVSTWSTLNCEDPNRYFQNHIYWLFLHIAIIS